jgi:hypothetical protein
MMPDFDEFFDKDPYNVIADEIQKDKAEENLV